MNPQTGNHTALHSGSNTELKRFSGFVLFPPEVPAYQKALWLLPVLLHIAAFCWRIQHPHFQPYDSREYLQAASLLSNGTWFTHPLLPDYLSAEIYSKRLLGYPLFLSAVHFFCNPLPAVYALQALLSLCTGLIVLHSACVSGATRQGYLRMLPLCLIFPAQYIYANLIMSETLLQLLLTVAFYCVLRFTQAPTAPKREKALWGYNLFLGLALLTKPVLTYFWLPNMVFMWWLSRRYKAPFSQSVWVMPLVLLGICTNNYQKTGYFHFNAIKEVNLLYYNANYLLQAQNPAQAEALIDSARARSESQPTFKARQEFMGRTGTEVLLNYPFAYAVFHAKGVFNFFIDPGRFDLYSFFGPEVTGTGTEGFLTGFSKNGYAGVGSYLKKQPLGLIFLLLVAGLTGLAGLVFLVLFAFNHPISPVLRSGLLLIVCYVALLTGPLGAARFRLPVWPLIVLSAGLYRSRNGEQAG